MCEWALLPLLVPAGLGGRCPERRGAGGEAAVLPPEETHVGIRRACELQVGLPKGDPGSGSSVPMAGALKVKGCLRGAGPIHGWCWGARCWMAAPSWWRGVHQWAEPAAGLSSLSEAE